MTLVWLSPALPADRAELAAALPSDLALFSLPSLDEPTAFDGLAAGSLCVATVFETELLERLAGRPEDVRLLVVGPPDYPGPLPSPPGGRQPDVLRPTSSMTEVADAISSAVMGLPPTSEMAATAGLPTRSRTRSRMAAAGAVLAGLAIGGVVIGVTEGSSSASANRAANNGGPAQFPGGGQLPGGGPVPGGGQFPGGPGGSTFNGNGPASGGRFDRDAIEQQILSCLRQKGFTGSANNLRLRAADPQLRQAFATCIQQLAGGSSQLPGRP